MTSAQALIQSSAGQRHAALAASALVGAKNRKSAVSSGSVVALPGAADVLQRIGRSLQVARGRTVIEAGSGCSHIYKVTEGVLRVVRILPDGRRHIARFLQSGDFFGVSDMAEQDSSVEAITDCDLTRYDRKDFDAILDSDAAAGRQLFRLMCRQLESSNRLLLLLGRKTASERLASFLLSFARTASATRRDQEIYLPMSRCDIADHLGLTIETVSRLITKFRTQRWISLTDSHTIKVIAPDVLEDLAAD